MGRQRSPGEPGAGGQACVAGLRRRPLSAVGWLRAGRPPGAGASPAETPAWRSGRADRTGASGCKPAHAASHSGRGARRRRRQAGGREPARVRWQGQSGPKPRGRRSPKAQRQEVRPQGRCGGPRAGVAPRPVWRPGVVTGEADGRTLPLHSAPGRAEGGWALGTWQPQAGRTRTAAVSVLRPWPPRPQHGPPTRAAEGAGLPLCSHTPQCSPPCAGAACRSRSSAGRQRSRARGRHGLGHLPGAPQPHRGARGVPCTRSPGARGLRATLDPHWA